MKHTNCMKGKLCDPKSLGILILEEIEILSDSFEEDITNMALNDAY